MGFFITLGINVTEEALSEEEKNTMLDFYHIPMGI